MELFYNFPSEDDRHEGIWLNWPHAYTYGIEYCEEIEHIWVEMVQALHNEEKVHIVAYNETEKQRITKLLNDNKINMNQVDFVIAKSDDVWSRDTGPIFVYDKNDVPIIIDFGFDGWGKKTKYKYDNKIPEMIASKRNLPIVSVPDFILEGGSVELDGKGTMMACKSSVISKNRNSKMTQKQAEEYIRTYLGVTNFIWLDGVTDEDITDAHIDGIARFYDEETILTVSETDFFDLYEDISEDDNERLVSSHNAKGQKYEVIEMPMTSKNVKNLDYKGSYLNYYVANNIILLPVYGDVNDKIAIEILSKLYSNRKIIPINVTSLYQYGGMIHCITQQQPE